MMQLEIFKKNWIYFLVIGVFVLIFVSYLMVLFSKNTTQPSTSPLPSSIPVNSTRPTVSFSPSFSNRPSQTPVASSSANSNKPETGVSYQTINQTEQQKIDRDNAVGQLIKRLPHSESNFSLDYNISKNSFEVTLNKNNLNAANSQFDQYLKNNGIQNRNWLYNLIVK